METDTFIDVSIGVETLAGVTEPRRCAQLNQKLPRPLPEVLAPSVLATRAHCNERGRHELGKTLFWLELLSELGGDLLRLVLALELVLQRKVAYAGDIEQRIQELKPRILDGIRRELGWPQLMLMGKGETTSKELATAAEIASRKLLAALFIVGDYPAVRTFLAPHFAREITVRAGEADPKTALQNVAQAMRAGPPKYEAIDARGPDHDKVFTVRVSIRGMSAIGSGKSKKDAEKHGASKLLARIPRAGGNEKKRVVFDPGLHVAPAGQGALLNRAEKLLAFAMKDSRLLSIALTHPSRLNEVRHGPPALSNAVFASLGSQVLRVLLRIPVVRDPRRWWGRSVDGFNRVQGYVLSERVLGPFARNAGLLSVIQVGKGQSAGLNDSIAMESLQACAAALFLDAEMRFSAERLVESILGRKLEAVQLSFQGFDSMSEADGKTLLQEACQAMGIRAQYEIVGSEGPQHARSYFAEVTISDGAGSYRFRGEGCPNKSSAEQAASRLPLRVFSAFSKGARDLAEVVELDDPAARGFVRMLIRRLVATIRQGGPGWRDLSRAGVFGADVLVAGTRSEALRSARCLHEIVLRVAPEVEDELALLIEKGAARRPPDPREHLVQVSKSLAERLDKFDVAGAVELQSTPHFRDLQAAAGLCSRLGMVNVERLSGAALRNLTAVLRGWTFEFTRGFDTSVEVLADRGSTLEFLSVIFRELTALSIGPHFELSLERRGDGAVMAIRASNFSRDGLGSRFALPNVLVAGIEASVAASGIEVSWPSPLTTDGNDPWADRVVGRLFDSATVSAPGLDTFARGAHDLKNILLAIDGQLENAREHRERRFQHLAAAEQNLLTARGAVRHLASSLRPLPDPQYAKFSFSQLMKSFVADLHQRLPRGISIQSHQSSSEVQVLGDATLLHSALENLCKNAAEAQPNGGILKVEWLHDPSTGEILVEVADSGPGVPPAVLEALASGRQSASTKPDGNGLGLLSVQRIVATHGGTFSVRSSGAGTSCTILLHAWTPVVEGAPVSPVEVVGRGVGNVQS